MTYEETKQRLDEWLNGECVDITPEILVCCYTAVNKLIPRKPMERDLWETSTATGHSCPKCGNNFPIGICKTYKYCPDCGQALDWSKE